MEGGGKRLADSKGAGAGAGGTIASSELDSGDPINNSIVRGTDLGILVGGCEMSPLTYDFRSTMMAIDLKAPHLPLLSSPPPPPTKKGCEIRASASGLHTACWRGFCLLNESTPPLPLSQINPSFLSFSVFGSEMVGKPPPLDPAVVCFLHAICNSVLY